MATGQTWNRVQMRAICRRELLPEVSRLTFVKNVTNKRHVLFSSGRKAFLRQLVRHHRIGIELGKVPVEALTTVRDHVGVGDHVEGRV